MKKRRKKMPWAKYKSIQNRFLDIRFSGLEDAINAQDNSKLKGRRKNIKDDYFQSVYGATSFDVKKHKPGAPLNHREGKEPYDFDDTLNNYQEDALYTGHATLRMYRHHRGKKHNYLITIEDIPEQEENKC